MCVCVCGWGGEGIGGSLLFRNLHHTSPGVFAFKDRQLSCRLSVESLLSTPGFHSKGKRWGSTKPNCMNNNNKKNVANIVRMKITTGKVTWLRKSRG